MTRNIIKSAMFGFIIVTIISCQSPEKKVDTAEEEVIEAKKDLQKAQDEFNADYANYKLEIEKKILDNEMKINELKEKRLNVKKEKRQKYDQKIVELSEKNAELKSKISLYQYENKDKWETFKSELNHDMDELGQAINDLFKDNVKE